jgi:lipopolysaccharide export system protein LptA
VSFVRVCAIGLALALTNPVAALAQASVAFGGLSHDTSLPVEVAADRLEIDQDDGTAIFTGNVLISQGEMRLSAGTVRVVYADQTSADGTGEIQNMRATGGVTLVNGAEAAEASQAVYDIDAGTIHLTGDVIMTQGRTAIAGNSLKINLNNGSGVIEGRVRTVLSTGN